MVNSERLLQKSYTFGQFNGQKDESVPHPSGTGQQGEAQDPPEHRLYHSQFRPFSSSTVFHHFVSQDYREEELGQKESPSKDSELEVDLDRGTVAVPAVPPPAPISGGQFNRY